MKKENELVRRRMAATGERYAIAKSKLRAEIALERWIDRIAVAGASHTTAREKA